MLHDGCSSGPVSVELTYLLPLFSSILTMSVDTQENDAKVCTTRTHHILFLNSCLQFFIVYAFQHWNTQLSVFSNLSNSSSHRAQLRMSVGCLHLTSKRSLNKSRYDNCTILVDSYNCPKIILSCCTVTMDAIISVTTVRISTHYHVVSI